MRFVGRQHTSPRIEKVLMTKHMLTMILRWCFGVVIHSWPDIRKKEESECRKWNYWETMEKIIHTKQTIQPFILLSNRGHLASKFWLGEDIVIQQRNVEMKWFFNKFPYLHRQFYKVQWSSGAKRTLLSCFFGISSNSENMNCSVCDEWLEMIQKYHPRWR